MVYGDRLRGRRRRGRSRADARRHRLQRPALLLLPIGRDQRVHLRRVRRVRRPDQRRRHGQRRRPSGSSARTSPGSARSRDMENPPTFGDPDRMTSAELHRQPRRGRRRRRPHQQRRQQQGRLPDDRRRDVQRRHGHRAGHPEGLPDLLRDADADAHLGQRLRGSGSALRQSCANLVGTAGITAGDCVEVGDATAAVEMSVSPPAAPTPDGRAGVRDRHGADRPVRRRHGEPRERQLEPAERLVLLAGPQPVRLGPELRHQRHAQPVGRRPRWRQRRLDRDDPQRRGPGGRHGVPALQPRLRLRRRLGRRLRRRHGRDQHEQRCELLRHRRADDRQRRTTAPSPPSRTTRSRAGPAYVRESNG